MPAGYDVAVGRLGKRNVDFVYQRHVKRIYAQVAYMISDDSARDREFGNLLKIRDGTPKMVVFMDETAGGPYQGIEHIHNRGLPALPDPASS